MAYVAFYPNVRKNISKSNAMITVTEFITLYTTHWAFSPPRYDKHTSTERDFRYFAQAARVIRHITRCSSRTFCYTEATRHGREKHTVVFIAMLNNKLIIESYGFKNISAASKKKKAGEK